MMQRKTMAAAAAVIAAVAVGAFVSYERAAAVAGPVPKFQLDPFWPKALPNKWMLGQVGGTFVDSHDHLWVTTRPKSLDENDKYAAASPPQADCCTPSPPVLEFDQAGN